MSKIWIAITPIKCKIISWKNLPTKAKSVFPHPSGMGSSFFNYDNEWYCIDYLSTDSDSCEYENETLKSTTMSCNQAGNSIIVMEEFTYHYVQKIAKLLAMH